MERQTVMLMAQPPRKSPATPPRPHKAHPPGAPPDEVYLSDSPAEPAPAVLGPPSQGDSRVSSPILGGWDKSSATPAEALLLPRVAPSGLALISSSWWGPVPHPVAEDLTTTYTQKAKQASECMNSFSLFRILQFES